MYAVTINQPAAFFKHHLPASLNYFKYINHFTEMLYGIGLKSGSSRRR